MESELLIDVSNRIVHLMFFIGVMTIVIVLAIGFVESTLVNILNELKKR